MWVYYLYVMDETTHADDVRTEIDLADDETLRPREEVPDERKSRRVPIAFDVLEDGDVVRVNDDLYRVWDADDPVTVLDDGAAALVQDGDDPLAVSLVNSEGTHDVETLYVAGMVDAEGAAEEDDSVDVDAHAFDAEDEGDARGTVAVDALEGETLVLVGDTYDAKEHIKRVDYQAWNFDGDRKVWEVDVSALQDLHEALQAGGFRLVDARDDGADSEAEDGDDLQRFREIVDRVDVGQAVTVDYEQKNRQGHNSKSGVVTTSRRATEEWEEEPRLSFERDDGQTMRLGLLDDGTLALFTTMSHAPLVGFVEHVHVDGADEEETGDAVAA